MRGRQVCRMHSRSDRLLRRRKVNVHRPPDGQKQLRDMQESGESPSGCRCQVLFPVVLRRCKVRWWQVRLRRGAVRPRAGPTTPLTFTSTTISINCGQCGHACLNQRCQGGKCVDCAPGLTGCSYQCVNTQNDNQNCGSCFNQVSRLQAWEVPLVGALSQRRRGGSSV